MRIHGKTIQGSEVTFKQSRLKEHRTSENKTKKKKENDMTKLPGKSTWPPEPMATNRPPVPELNDNAPRRATAQRVTVAKSEQTRVFTQNPSIEERSTTTSSRGIHHPHVPPKPAPKCKAFARTLIRTTMRHLGHNRDEDMSTRSKSGQCHFRRKSTN